MVYDIWGSWSPLVGPNSPLADACSSYQEGSATSAVKAWTSAKFPANQILLGVPAYGHSFHVAKSDAIQSGHLAPYPPFNAALQPKGDSEDSPAGVDECGNQVSVGGIFNFWGLVQGGFLTNAGVPAKGIWYRFGTCSKTVRILARRLTLPAYVPSSHTAICLQLSYRSHGIV
jgi:chitinase